MKKLIYVIPLVLLIGFGASAYLKNNSNNNIVRKEIITSANNLNQGEDAGKIEDQPHLLSIETLKKGNHPGSDIEIEQTLEPGSNYQRFIASYKSEGLKIYALLTVPDTQRPKAGYPVIIFNHGYIPPKEYSTTDRYVAYTDAFSKNGYIVFKPDFRGHGESEGEAMGGYGSNAYTVDVLNALSSVKKFKDADPEKIGMWGHSMGGFITIRAMVASIDIKAGVIWAGVVASYPDLISSWRARFVSPPPGARSSWRQALIEKYGSPESNPIFWNSISANSYLKDISGPIQLHHGSADTSVPIAFSQKLEQELKQTGKEVEAFYYEGDDHNLANNLGIVLQRSVDFFNRYLE